MTDSDVLLKENAFIEAKEFVADLGRKVEDADMGVLGIPEGFDLRGAALYYVQTYDSTSTFIRDLRVQLARKGSLTDRQLRAALNVLQSELKSGAVPLVRKGTGSHLPMVGSASSAPVPAPAPVLGDRPPVPAPVLGEPQHACYTCGEKFHSVSEVLKHKAEVHVAVPVLATEEKSFLDISSIPDGRYACLDTSGKPGSMYVYFSVKTVKKRTYRSKRYRYGKFHVGSEWIEPGTIEVRTWSQDAKKLVGQQKPGEGYQGEHVEQLIEIAVQPDVWAKVFGFAIGACSICGKTLTDDDSRAIAIGPECDKKYGRDYWTRFKSGVTRLAPEPEPDPDPTAAAAAFFWPTTT